MYNKRIDLLDGWRTLAVLFMVVYHALYDAALFGLLPAELSSSSWAVAVRSFAAVSFILLCGISCSFSRSNRQRGIRLCVCALVITAVSYALGSPVWFGVLHLLGVSLLIYARVQKKLADLNETPVCAAALIVFILLYVLLQDLRVSVPGLWWLGLRTASFYSADYYPLLPWFFLFLAGTAMGRRVIDLPNALVVKKLPRWFTFPGRHALLIYLLHQPLLYGLFYGLSKI